MSTRLISSSPTIHPAQVMFLSSPLDHSCPPFLLSAPSFPHFSSLFSLILLSPPLLSFSPPPLPSLICHYPRSFLPHPCLFPSPSCLHFFSHLLSPLTLLLLTSSLFPPSYLLSLSSHSNPSCHTSPHPSLTLPHISASQASFTPFTIAIYLFPIFPLPLLSSSLSSSSPSPLLSLSSPLLLPE